MNELSEASKKLYDYILKRLRTHFKVPETDNSFLLNYEEVIKHIESLNLSHNTKKTYLITIYAYLMRVEDTRFETIKKEYQKKMKEYNEKQREIYESQEFTESEKQKFLSWPEIQKIRKQCWEAVEDYWTFQDYLIVCLYTLNAPVRLDYGDMKVVEKDDDNVGNRLVWNDKECYFLFREYKTASRYGALKIPVSADLKSVLEYWKAVFNWNPVGGYLLYNMRGNGEAMDSRTLGANIIRIFKKFSGKACGVDMIRHSYVCYMREGEPAYKKLKEMADNMMHSPMVSQMVYKKL